MRTAEGERVYEALGAADDARDPDGLTVFSYPQAQERGPVFFAGKARQLAGHTQADQGPSTIAAALDDYLRERERKGSKGVRADRYASNARIIPALGSVQLASLTAKRLRKWLEGIEKAPKLVRTGKSLQARNTRAINMSDLEAVRARRALE